MKIAYIVCTFPPYKGGMGNSAYHFARIMAKSEYDVTVFTPDYTSPIAPLLTMRGELKGRGGRGEFVGEENKVREVRTVRLKPLFKYGNAAFLPQLLWRLAGYDIVHLHYPFYGAAGIVMLRKMLFGKKMKLVIHYHMDSAAKGVRGFIFKVYQLFVLPILLRQAKIITCASLDYVKHSSIADYYKNHKEKFRQTFFGVDLKQFAPSPNTSLSESVRKERGVNKNILFVGGLDQAHYFKGLENLLKAVKIIKYESQPDVLLNIIGEGGLKPYYKNLARELCIDKQVNFIENANNNKLVDYYNYCDAVVLPSINQGEAFGLVLLEAMACAKPIIASNLPGVRSVFKNGKHGLLAQPDNVDDLVDKLKIILSDKELARKMGQYGRELAESKYTWDKVGKRLNEIYYFVKYTPK